VTGTLSTFQSTAIGLRLAVTINPPAPTITNMKYISQKIADGSPRSADNAPALDDVGVLGHGGDLSGFGANRKNAKDHDDDALPETEIEKVVWKPSP